MLNTNPTLTPLSAKSIAAPALTREETCWVKVYEVTHIQREHTHKKPDLEKPQSQTKRNLKHGQGKD